MLFAGLPIQTIKLVSRGQTTIFAQGRYRFQYKRRALFVQGAYTEGITPLREL